MSKMDEALKLFREMSPEEQQQFIGMAKYATVSDMSTTDRVYSIPEVCDILQLTTRTIYKYIREGKLEATKVGKYWRVTHKSLQEFLRKGTKR